MFRVTRSSTGSRIASVVAVLVAVVLFAVPTMFTTNVVQQQFADQGAWYLIGLGVVAILFALFLPKGLWSVVAGRVPVQLPVGYRLRPVTGSRPKENPQT